MGGGEDGWNGFFVVLKNPQPAFSHLPFICRDPHTVVGICTDLELVDAIPDGERVFLICTEDKGLVLLVDLLHEERNTLALTLRNPLDTKPTETEGVRSASLMGPAPKPPVIVRRPNAPVAIARAPEPPKTYTVEAIRGGQRGNEEVR